MVMQDCSYRIRGPS